MAKQTDLMMEVMMNMSSATELASEVEPITEEVNMLEETADEFEVMINGDVDSEVPVDGLLQDAEA